MDQQAFGGVITRDTTPATLIGGKINRQQGKSTLNNTKNTAPPKINGPTTARLEYPNTIEAEESDLKITLWKMLRPLKSKLKSQRSGG